MKKIALFLLLLPAISKAQDTCGIKKSKDAFTRESKMSTGFMSFQSGGNQLQISVDATSSEIDVFLWVKEDGKCFDSQSNAQINFEGDRLKANYKNTGSMNCEGAFHFTFRNLANTPSNLKRLTDKKIASIKLTGNGKTETILAFDEEQRQLLQKKITCLVNEAKTLIK